MSDNESKAHQLHPQAVEALEHARMQPEHGRAADALADAMEASGSVRARLAVQSRGIRAALAKWHSMISTSVVQTNALLDALDVYAAGGELPQLVLDEARALVGQDVAAVRLSFTPLEDAAGMLAIDIVAHERPEYAAESYTGLDPELLGLPTRIAEQCEFEGAGIRYSLQEAVTDALVEALEGERCDAPKVASNA